MKQKRDIIPLIIAAVIALGVTVLARWLVPGKGSVKSSNESKRDISMPDIPLMAKQVKKIREISVLVTKNDIKRGEKIIAGHFSWKRWPKDASQPNFIARTLKKQELNNKGDYKKALNMWALHDIPAGVPITMSMLSKVDIIKKEKEALEKKKKQQEEARKKKQQEEAKKKNEEKKNIINKGMRAVTFPIEQKSAASAAILKTGDLVDLIIPEHRANKTKMHKYKGLKVLAIDGIVEKPAPTEKEKERSMLADTFSQLSNSFSNPKSITVEVDENLVEEMLKQAGESGVILSVRNQNEKDIDDGGEETEHQDTLNTRLFNLMSSLDQANNLETFIKAQKEKEEKARSMETFMHAINQLDKPEMPVVKQKVQSAQEKGSGYEIVSGKIVNTEDDNQSEEEKEEKNTINIYRKLTPEEIELDKDGKRVNTSSSSSSSVSSSYSR